MSKQKKGRGREAKVNTPIEELDQKETLMHYNAVLIEEQNSKFQLVLERMDALSEQVDRKIEALRDDMLDMERRICSKINRITERHECRLATLEANQ